MFRLLAFFYVLLSSVSAFMPISRLSSRAPSLAMVTFEKEAGVTSPLGYFDPLGLAKNKESFEQYRAAELKHGRVAQLAVIGYIVPEVFKFPGEIAPGVSFASIPNGVAAIDAIPSLGWLQIFFLIGSVDYYGFFVLGDTEGKGKTAEELAKAKDQELNHGRLAMIAILELLRHDSQNVVGGMYSGDHLITGLPFLY